MWVEFGYRMRHGMAVCSAVLGADIASDFDPGRMHQPQRVLYWDHSGCDYRVRIHGAVLNEPHSSVLQLHVSEMVVRAISSCTKDLGVDSLLEVPSGRQDDNEGHVMVSDLIVRHQFFV